MIRAKNYFQRFCFFLLLSVTAFTPKRAAGVQVESQRDVIVDAILSKIKEDPNHSDSWRMLGKILAKQEKFDTAIDAYEKAIKIDDRNAAAHYDLGILLSELQRTTESKVHFQKLCDIAPEGEYTRRVLATGFVPEPTKRDVAVGPESPESPALFIGAAQFAAVASDGVEEIAQVDYQIQTFDGADDLASGLDQLSTASVSDAGKRWRIMGETGVLYNTNVALAPISRQLAASSDSSAQWIANTELEYSAWKNESWRAGPIGRGNFTTNESQVSQLNLSSYQLGSFFERSIEIGSNDWISRFEYQFSLDQFGGENIGDRHSITGSMMKLDSAAITYFYAILASTEFRDDGANPNVTSLDGNSYTVGVSRFFLTSNPRVPTWNLGLDAEIADTEGQDNQYFSLRVHGQSTLNLANRWSLISSAGLGGASFSEFTGIVSRDEMTGRLGIKLQRQLSVRSSISFVANYDRFVSDNETFDLERFTGGIVTTFRY